MTFADSDLAKPFRKTVHLTAAVAALAVATPALAEPITLDPSNVGESFTINYNGFVDDSSQAIDGLSAEITFTLTSADFFEYSFDYEVANTSDGGVDSRISSFAFNSTPDFTSASATGDYSFIQTNSNYPNGIGTVDVCFKSRNSGSCAGNGGGVGAGDTGSGTITLSYPGALSEITLDDFFVRYQGITGAGNVTSASGEQTSTSSTGGTTSSTGGTPVPEPGMLGMFGLGLVGLGFVANRRRKQAAA